MNKMKYAAVIMLTLVAVLLGTHRNSSLSFRPATNAEPGEAPPVGTPPEKPAPRLTLAPDRESLEPNIADRISELNREIERSNAIERLNKDNLTDEERGRLMGLIFEEVQLKRRLVESALSEVQSLLAQGRTQ